MSESEKEAIVASLAALDPVVECYQCFFCFERVSRWDGDTPIVDHKKSCLWLRAQQK